MGWPQKIDIDGTFTVSLVTGVIYTLEGIMSILLRQPALMLICGGCGFLLSRWGIFGGNTVKRLRKANAFIFLPVYVFLTIAKTPVDALANLEVFWFALALSAAALVVGGMALRSMDSVPVRLQGAFRGSATIYSAAFAGAIPNELFAGSAVLCASLYSTAMNIIFIGLFWLSKTEQRGRISFASLLDPVLIAAVLGLVAAFSGFELPQMADWGLGFIKSAAVPLAFVLMGVQLCGTGLQKNSGPVWGICAVKLIVFPLAGLLIASFLGADKSFLVMLLPIIASPSASSGYSLAQSMNQNETLAGKCIIVSQVLAPLTVTLLMLLI